jgi:riboflavin kinase/FMN adenylyltransferase
MSRFVATIGFFDGVHLGHRYLLRQVTEAAAERGLLSAAVTFPVHPRQVLHPDFTPELLTTYEEKVAALHSCDIHHIITLRFTPELAALSACEFMKLLHDDYAVDVLLIGHDHRFGHNRTEGFDDYVRYGKELGMEVLLASAQYSTDERATISSSLIRTHLHQGDVTTAEEMLGYRYSIEGTVEGGYHVGHTIGYPTANLKPSSLYKLIPADGVYAAYVTIFGVTYEGMLYIGKRPTLENGENRSIEMNIFRFDHDIYRKPIRITFVRYVRGDRKFADTAQLVAQLEADEERIHHIFQELV